MSELMAQSFIAELEAHRSEAERAKLLRYAIEKLTPELPTHYLGLGR